MGEKDFCSTLTRLTLYALVFLGLGIILNTVTWRLNGGMMPAIYEPDFSQSKLTIFCDWITIGNLIVNIGDLLMAASALMIVVVLCTLLFELLGQGLARAFSRS